MKTAQLPPVRVDPSVREEIVSVLQEGESLSAFIEASAIEAARVRKAQAEFLARGRASLAEARHSGEWFAADDALAAMRTRLEARMKILRKDKGSPGTGR